MVREISITILRAFLSTIRIGRPSLTSTFRLAFIQTLLVPPSLVIKMVFCGTSETRGVKTTDGSGLYILIQVWRSTVISNRIPREPSAEVAGVVAVAVELQAGLRVPLPPSIQVLVADGTGL
jgi:hypothetical protein